MSSLWGGGLWSDTGWGGPSGPTPPEPPGPCVPTTERNIPAELQAIFESPVQHPAILARIQPAGRSAFGLTTHNEDITYDDGDGTIVYVSMGNASPSTTESTLGLETDGTDIALLLDTVTLERIIARYYAGSRVKLYRVDYEALGAGHAAIASGELGTIPTDDVMANGRVVSLSAIANRPVAHETSTVCPYARFGAGFCANGTDVGGLSDGPTATVLTGTIATVVNRHHLQLSGITCAADFAAIGIITFPDSVDFPDYPFDVLSNSANGADVYLPVPLPFLPEVGDAVALEEGCLRTWEACQAHNNELNFGGQLLVSEQVLVKTQIGV